MVLGLLWSSLCHTLGSANVSRCFVEFGLDALSTWHEDTVTFHWTSRGRLAYLIEGQSDSTNDRIDDISGWHVELPPTDYGYHADLLAKVQHSSNLGFELFCIFTSVCHNGRKQLQLENVVPEGHSNQCLVTARHSNRLISDVVIM